jgi:2-keto-4-pentenoate hydratase/2-oxohepta-3-ene-1,7-dioic acid hydratase in catechol pathway
MIILRASYQGQAFYGVAEGTKVLSLKGTPYEGIGYAGEGYPLEALNILAPCEPSKVVAVGLNYAKHAGEMKETLIGSPVLFIKPSTAVIAHGEGIVYPKESSRVDYEAELGVVIGRRCKCVSEEEAENFIFGYTAVNDVTARDIQKADGQWTRSKSFDTFCPIGPYIDTQLKPDGRRVRSVLNGETMQDSNTDNMLFNVPKLVSFISSCMTLLPGDVIATGTPEGIGPMNKGDTIEIMIEGLPVLRNFVK